MNICNIQRLDITGTEQFSEELLYPWKLNLIISVKIINIIVKYYKAIYKLINIRKLFTADLNNSITVQDQINQYGRCQIELKIFELVISL